jgi:hypothetical protein
MLFKRHAHWVDLYDRLKGPDWPQTAPPEVDFYLLPGWVQQEMHNFGYQPNKDFPKRFYPGGEKNIMEVYLPGQDGGGITYGQEYIELVKQRYSDRRFSRCYEWCSGPGFIGYGLLDHGLCDTLCLTDIYDPALLCAEETRNYAPNLCQDQVDIYLLKDLALLPDHEQFDLVVSNPPHADGFDVEDQWFANNNRLTSDINWEAHRNFFVNIKNHLAPDGIILLQENHAGSTVETFRPWIENAGLKITDSFCSGKWYDHGCTPDRWPKIQIYYIEIQHASKNFW